MSNLRTLNFAIYSSAIEDLFDGLEDAAAAAIRPAAQAGAQVMYDQVRNNVQGLRQHTGNLLRSIYQVYRKDSSIDGVIASYAVSWNARKAPHAHLVEYGHIQRYREYIARKGPKKGQLVTDRTHPIAPKQVAATAFMRRAIAAKSEAAVDAMRDELLKRLDEHL